MDKIFDVMKEIASWDTEKCFRITQEMLPNLLHNFNVLMKGQTLRDLFKEIDSSHIEKQYLKTHKTLI